MDCANTTAPRSARTTAIRPGTRTYRRSACDDPLSTETTPVSRAQITISRPCRLKRTRVVRAQITNSPERKQFARARNTKSESVGVCSDGEPHRTGGDPLVVPFEHLRLAQIIHQERIQAAQARRPEWAYVAREAPRSTPI